MLKVRAQNNPQSFRWPQLHLIQWALSCIPNHRMLIKNYVSTQVGAGFRGLILLCPNTVVVRHEAAVLPSPH